MELFVRLIMTSNGFRFKVISIRERSKVPSVLTFRHTNATIRLDSVGH